MKTKLPDGSTLFFKDDEGFVRWCEAHPDGFFWNCGADEDGKIKTVSLLHSAMYKGKLCPHFRNRNLASGFADNLTRTHAKVCSTSRKDLERWAEDYKAGHGQKRKCSQCM